MSIITLSRQRGAGAEEIVDIICREIGYIALDKMKIGEAVAEYGYQASSLEKYDETKPSFWDFVSRERYRFIHAVNVTICELARKENVIIIGRGGFILLKDIPGVMRVKIIAPYDMRIKNLAQKGDNLEEIKTSLRNYDREGEGFLRHHYNADLNDPLLFDMVINTERTPYERAAKFIIDARKEIDKSFDRKDFEEKLSDLTLKLKVELAVMNDVKVDIRNLEVVVKKGNVVMSGIVSNENVKNACEQAALKVENIEKLDNRINIAAILPHPYEW